MIDKNKDFIAVVNSYDVETFDQTPDNGKIWDIYMVAASMADSPDIKVELKWGTEIIFVAHGNWQTENPEIQITGDGSKVLSMRLVNDTGQAETIRMRMKMGEQE